MLIVLRGNSGSGKSTTANLLRETAIENRYSRKIAIVEQDYLRRFILKEKETEGTDNIDLIFQTVSFALEHDYDVILEGIFYSKRYSEMFERLYDLSNVSHFYYFDVSLDETVKRHQSKPNAHEFGEEQMREWYKPQDLLGFVEEKVIPEYFSQKQVVNTILKDTGLI
jgi:ABC-type oligopeptide transport system ATPase subunit